jgi:hypothetical protein
MDMWLGLPMNKEVGLGQSLILPVHFRKRKSIVHGELGF